MMLRQVIISFIYVLPLALLGAEKEIQIPLDSKSWYLLDYSGITPNTISTQDNALHIQVKNSAAPLIYSLPQKQKVTKLAFKAEIKGNLKLKPSLQGSKGNDDFLLRVGLVYEGEKTLGFFQKIAAPYWIKKLFSLNKKGKGIQHIVFYNVYSDSRLKNKSRKHPHSDLLIEKFVVKNSKNGIVEANISIPPSKPVLAIWLSIDGDDTQSTYEVVLKSLKLSTL